MSDVLFDFLGMPVGAGIFAAGVYVGSHITRRGGES